MNILGKSECTAEQMAQYLISKNPNAKPWALEYAKIYLEEGNREGVRGDGAWIQSCKETGNFKFTGGTAVTFEQNNFCGLGVTSKGVKGHVFETPRLGIRAQIQHLKGYATTIPLNQACIDPRYKYINPKGKSPTFEELTGKWAVPGYSTSQANSLEDAMNKRVGYGFDIVNGVNVMKKIVVQNTPIQATKYYRVNVASCRNKYNAEMFRDEVKSKGFDAIVKYVDGYYKVQCGCFSKKENAEKLMSQIKASGFSAFIIYQ